MSLRYTLWWFIFLIVATFSSRLLLVPNIPPLEEAVHPLHYVDALAFIPVGHDRWLYRWNGDTPFHVIRDQVELAFLFSLGDRGRQRFDHRSHFGLLAVSPAGRITSNVGLSSPIYRR